MCIEKFTLNKDKMAYAAAYNEMLFHSYNTVLFNGADFFKYWFQFSLSLTSVFQQCNYSDFNGDVPNLHLERSVVNHG